mmetsp:Transcript_15075/g.38283  ORF Transcript_15075/g.38283 Transcript_15075/m.38283 type:complete len:219 (-) Transcript_15075:167-823(-)
MSVRIHSKISWFLRPSNFNMPTTSLHASASSASCVGQHAGFKGHEASLFAGRTILPRRSSLLSPLSLSSSTSPLSCSHSRIGIMECDHVPAGGTRPEGFPARPTFLSKGGDAAWLLIGCGWWLKLPAVTNSAVSVLPFSRGASALFIAALPCRRRRRTLRRRFPACPSAFASSHCDFSWLGETAAACDTPNTISPRIPAQSSRLQDLGSGAGVGHAPA